LWLALQKLQNQLPFCAISEYWLSLYSEFHRKPLENAMFLPPPDDTQRNHLHDQARRAATRLRQEAVDDFWRGADAAWQRVAQGGQALAQRSASRLRARLARHAQIRAAQAASSTTTTGA
jgi:hypothetical protein